jgi:hypothetical protein
LKLAHVSSEHEVDYHARMALVLPKNKSIIEYVCPSEDGIVLILRITEDKAEAVKVGGLDSGAIGVYFASDSFNYYILC